MINRVLPFSGIHNFRDYGGYKTSHGRALRQGVLFRSGQHLQATQDDLSKISALDLSSVIDLRGNQERISYPCPRPDNFQAQLFFVDGETAGHAQDGRSAGPDVVTAKDAKAVMKNMYAEMPFRPNLITVFQHYFTALAERDGPSLVHCLAGKDRTGIAVALLHDMLGVHRDDMMSDYLLTNSAGNIAARIAAGADSVRASFGPDMEDDAVRVLMSVEAEFLDTALITIRNQYGSLTGYRRDVLRVTEDIKAAIEARLLI
jgi:protein-tyrosine phosphatase